MKAGVTATPTRGGSASTKDMPSEGNTLPTTPEKMPRTSHSRPSLVAVPLLLPPHSTSTARETKQVVQSQVRARRCP